MDCLSKDSGYYYRMRSAGDYGGFLFLAKIVPPVVLSEDTKEMEAKGDMDRSPGMDKYTVRTDFGGVIKFSPQGPLLGGLGPMYKRGIFREIANPLGYSAFSDMATERTSLSLSGSFSGLDSKSSIHGVFLNPLPNILSLYYYGRYYFEDVNESGDSLELPTVGLLFRPLGNGLLFGFRKLSDFSRDRFFKSRGLYPGFVGNPDFVGTNLSGDVSRLLYIEMLWVSTRIGYVSHPLIGESDSWYLEIPYFWGEFLNHFVFSLWLNVEGHDSRFFLRSDTLYSGGKFVFPGYVEHVYALIENVLYRVGFSGGYRSFYFLDSSGKGGDDWFKYSVGVVLNPRGLVVMSFEFSDHYKYPYEDYCSLYPPMSSPPAGGSSIGGFSVETKFFQHVWVGNFKLLFKFPLGVRFPSLRMVLPGLVMFERNKNRLKYTSDISKPREYLEIGLEERIKRSFNADGTSEETNMLSLYAESHTGFGNEKIECTFKGGNFNFNFSFDFPFTNWLGFEFVGSIGDWLFGDSKISLKIYTVGKDYNSFVKVGLVNINPGEVSALRILLSAGWSLRN